MSYLSSDDIRYGAPGSPSSLSDIGFWPALIAAVPAIASAGASIWGESEKDKAAKEYQQKIEDEEDKQKEKALRQKLLKRAFGVPQAPAQPEPPAQAAGMFSMAGMQWQWLVIGGLAILILGFAFGRRD